MKILLHVGVGNLDRPYRWQFVNDLFSNLAITLEKLGNECLVWNHSDANNNNTFNKRMVSRSVDGLELQKAKEFDPDWVFTWNGNSEGDKKIINVFGENKMVFGELGFFDHYNTLYFDFKGVNGDSENLSQHLNPLDEAVFKKLLNKYKLPRKFDGDYIFVPLQDESDTNITLHSDIKKMDDLLQYVEDNLDLSGDLKVLYKKHPKAPCTIKNRDNFIEVIDNVHHYLPYAKKIVGINSTVLLESLLYTNNVVTLGKGITSRILSDGENKQYITHLKGKQFNWGDLNNVDLIKNSYFYKKMIQ